MLLRVLERRRLADPAHLLGVLLGHTVGNRSVRWIRDAIPVLLPLPLRVRELDLELLEGRLQLTGAGDDLVGRRFAQAFLLGADLVATGAQRAPALVRVQQPVEQLVCPLPGHGSAERSWVRARRPQVDHGRESR